ncbi:MAG: outer membrane protein transport protein, partial [Victivallales bacterium]|nr:outer membrane protein transport protein [Victivallales bacterium]
MDTELAVVEATPSISWKVLDNLSIGAGLMIQYATIEMTRDNYPVGHLKLKGDSVALGYIAGLTYQPFEKTHVGLSYRSRMTQELDLDGRLTGTPYGTLRGSADADFDLPAVANFGISQALNDKWEVMMDISWTKAYVFDELSVTFDKNSKLGQAVYASTGSFTQKQEMKWKDSWRFAIGTEYKLTDKWTLRCGTAFDRT